MERCTAVYDKFYVCKCSLDLSLPYLRNIQSPAVTRGRIPKILCYHVQNKRKWLRTWRMPVEFFLFSQIYFMRKSKLLKILENLKSHYQNFTKSSRYCICFSQIWNHIIKICFNQIFPDSSIETCLKRAKEWEVQRESSDKVIHVYPTNPAL